MKNFQVILVFNLRWWDLRFMASKFLVNNFLNVYHVIIIIMFIIIISCFCLNENWKRIIVKLPGVEVVGREEILLVVRGRHGGGENQQQAQALQHLLWKYFNYEIKMLHWSPTRNISQLIDWKLFSLFRSRKGNITYRHFQSC